MHYKHVFGNPNKRAVLNRTTTGIGFDVIDSDIYGRVVFFMHPPLT